MMELHHGSAKEREALSVGASSYGLPHPCGYTRETIESQNERDVTD